MTVVSGSWTNNCMRIFTKITHMQKVVLQCYWSVNYILVVYTHPVVIPLSQFEVISWCFLIVEHLTIAEVKQKVYRGGIDTTGKSQTMKVRLLEGTIEEEGLYVGCDNIIICIFIFTGKLCYYCLKVKNELSNRCVICK